MKVNELRIGNYVYNNWPDNVRIVTGLSYENGGLENEIFLDDCSEIGESDPCLLPIELTEEWLLKFGFRPMGVCGYTAPSNTATWRFSIGNDFIPSIWLNHTIISDGYRGCKYVHQLQNLYFALTGDELRLQDVAVNKSQNESTSKDNGVSCQ